MQCSAFRPQTPPPSRDLWLESPHSDLLPPPSYDDTLTDLPPDYTTTDALATAQTPEYTPFSSLNASLCSNVPNCLRLSCNTSPCSSLYLDEKSFYADIDFGLGDEGVRQHKGPKKKNNNNNKKPAPAPDPPPPPPPPEPPGDGNSGGDPPADSGAGGSGDGGEGGGDGGDGGDEKKGDDDWGDDWGTAAGKSKKKKNNKGKKVQDEEAEAERKKKEADAEAEAQRLKDEDEVQRKKVEEEAEQKKRDDEAAAATAAAASTAQADFSWANDTNGATDANDGWGAIPIAGGKKKKGKKGKVRNLGCLNPRFNTLTSP